MSVFPAISTASVVITGLARAFRDHTPYGLLNGTKRLRSQRTLGPLFNSIPGRGGVMSARLLALMGDSQEAVYGSPRDPSHSGVASTIKRLSKTSRGMFRHVCNKIHRDTLT